MVTGGSALVRVDLDHGGRWTSLRFGEREWLWQRDEPRRSRVAPGDPFADAGGLEECVPTVRGRPDHGDAWSRAWLETGDGAAEVRCADFTLRRVITTDGSLVSAGYRLSASRPYRSIGVEPMLGSVFDLAEARHPGDAVTVPLSGRVEWGLDIEEAAS